MSVNIAVIGPAKYAEEYAIRYAAAGHMVSIALMGGDDPDRTRNRMRVFDNISVCGIEDAAAIIGKTKNPKFQNERQLFQRYALRY